MAPLALAFERIIECRILSKKKIVHPVLDIGCGDGLFAKILFSGKVDTGIDPNNKELERAKKLNAYNELMKSVGSKIAKPNSSYNTIISNSVLEHIYDIEDVLRECHRLLKPNGSFFITVPSDKFDKYTVISQALLLFGMKKYQENYQKWFNKFWVHYHFYNKKKWKELVEKSGFQVIEIFTYAPKRVCMMNSFLVLFSVPEYITKKLFNRWTIFPFVRILVLLPFSLIPFLLMIGSEKSSTGGLVFMELKKNN